MPQTAAHDWFLPRLRSLLAEAEQAGYARDVAEAVITDLMSGALAAGNVPPPQDGWARDIGEPAGVSKEMPTPQQSVDIPFDEDPVPSSHIRFPRGDTL